jgi:uncharacterized protein YjiS (DUF1127 family)
VTKWLVRLTRNGARSLDLTPPLSAEGLLCALVLAPSTFPRNRFPSLFLHPDAKRARSRAAQIRTVVRHLAGKTRTRLELLTFDDRTDGGYAVISYRIADIKLERSAWLDRLELALVRVAVDRIGQVPDPALRERMNRLGALRDPRLAPTQEDHRAIEGALLDWGRCIVGTTAPGAEPGGA